MQRCAINPLPTDGRTARPVWRAACALWRTLMAAVFDPYRPEQHYMRGPGPRSRERLDGRMPTEHPT
jgi:hypothetical protein